MESSLHNLLPPLRAKPSSNPRCYSIIGFSAQLLGDFISLLQHIRPHQFYLYSLGSFNQAD